MNYSFTKEAELELYRAECYFRLYQKEDAFLDDLTDQLRIIQAMPKAFQVRYKNVRIVNFEHFRYSIHYSIYKNTIYILRIINQNQDF